MLCVPSHDPRNLGYEAERRFYEYINSLSIFQDIKYEIELKRLYGWHAMSIDYLLITHNGIIPVQIKYRRSRRRENRGIANFIKGLETIASVYHDKPVLFGLWISRLHPFLDNVGLLQTYKVQCVSHFDDLDTLVKKGVDAIVATLEQQHDL